MKDILINNVFTRYGFADACNYFSRSELSENEKVVPENIKIEHLIEYIDYLSDYIAITTNDNPKIKEEINFRYLPFDSIKSFETKNNEYMSPTFISGDEVKTAHRRAIAEWISTKKFKSGTPSVISPTLAKFNYGKIRTETASINPYEISCLMIAMMTPNKPAFYLDARSPTAIFPDLKLEDTMEFIKGFKRYFDVNKIQLLKTTRTKAKGIKRPMINGNFPQLLYSSGLKDLTLLSYIGHQIFVDDNLRMTNVLNKYKRLNFYTVGTNVLSIGTFNNKTLILASKLDLSEILKSIQHSLPEDVRKDSNKSELFYRILYRFFKNMSFESFKRLMKYKVNYKFKLIELFDYFFKTELKMEDKFIETTKEIAKRISKMTLGMAIEEVVGSNNENITPMEWDKIYKKNNRELVKIEAIIQNVTQHYQLAIIDRRIKRFGTIREDDVSFLDALNTKSVDLEEAKYILLSYLRVNWNSKTEKINK